MGCTAFHSTSCSLLLLRFLSLSPSSVLLSSLSSSSSELRTQRRLITCSSASLLCLCSLLVCTRVAPCALPRLSTSRSLSLGFGSFWECPVLGTGASPSLTLGFGLELFFEVCLELDCFVSGKDLVFKL